MGKRPMGLGKRVAELPQDALKIQGATSKSDLMEVVWDLAGLCNNGEGCDDDDATKTKVLEMLNVRRVGRGQKPLRV